MKEVSEFEARLLRILRCLMHRTSVEQSLSLFVQSVPRPRCLSRHCVELVQDGLSKGVTEWLARSGYLSGQFCENEKSFKIKPYSSFNKSQLTNKTNARFCGGDLSKFYDSSLW